MAALSGVVKTEKKTEKKRGLLFVLPPSLFPMFFVSCSREKKEERVCVYGKEKLYYFFSKR